MLSWFEYRPTPIFMPDTHDIAYMTYDWDNTGIPNNHNGQ